MKTTALAEAMPILPTALFLVSRSAQAASTISLPNPFSYGANVGWMNWRASTADGVEIGEYVCSGYIYGANVGWIYRGDRTSPARPIRTRIAAAVDRRAARGGFRGKFATDWLPA